MKICTCHGMETTVVKVDPMRYDSSIIHRCSITMKICATNPIDYPESIPETLYL